MDAAKKLFFDAPAVQKSMDRVTRKALARFGAFTQKSAKQSIRKRKKPAPPGSPPSSHTGLLKKFLYFAADKGGKDVVIGPVRLPRASGDAPPALEWGGETTPSGKLRRRKLKIGDWGELPTRDGGTVRIQLRTDRQVAAAQRYHDQRSTTAKKIRIAARPFMVPAKDKNLAKLPEIWAYARK